ncbi:MAG: hypothetical protein HUK24_07140 [Sphaerochaetaceae bacterium]|nr:hypothetical protein [Sphaerochaetaceae bacterium]
MKKIFLFLIILLVTLSLWALENNSKDPITFSGGRTQVSIQNGTTFISLSDNAKVNTDIFDLSAQNIEIKGENYRYVSAEGNVVANHKEKQITFKSPSVFLDRQTNTITADGWIELEDKENEAILSGAWFKYETEKETLQIQIMAKILKATDKGIMICKANIITFDLKLKTVVLKGNASVQWNGNTYNASLITVNLETEDISLSGSISGEFYD